MAKVSKDYLKNIVKECLLEILAEGLGTTSEIRESVRQVPKRTHPTAHTSYSEKPAQKVSNQNFDRAVQNAVKNVSADPIMQSLLSETAQTTLQKQAAADSRPGAMMSVLGAGRDDMPNVDPAEIFGGEATSKWADLAFAAPVNRNK